MDRGSEYSCVIPRLEALSVAERLECGSLLPLSDVQQRRQVARTRNAGAPSVARSRSWEDGWSQRRLPTLDRRLRTEFMFAPP